MTWFNRSQQIACVAIVAIVIIVPLILSFTNGMAPPSVVASVIAKEGTYAEQQQALALEEWQAYHYQKADDILLALWKKQRLTSSPEYDPSLALTMTDVAGIYRDWTRYKESKDIYGLLIAYTKDRSVLDYKALARQYNGLATTEYCEACAQKNPVERKKLFEQTDAHYKEAFDLSQSHAPDDKYFRGTVLANRANVARELGQQTIATQLEEDAERNGVEFFGIERSPNSPR